MAETLPKISLAEILEKHPQIPDDDSLELIVDVGETAPWWQPVYYPRKGLVENGAEAKRLEIGRWS